MTDPNTSKLTITQIYCSINSQNSSKKIISAKPITMSFQYYNTWWIKAKKDLENLFQRDETIRKTFKPINDRNLANSLIGGMYARYSVVVQALSTCLDQLAQVLFACTFLSTNLGNFSLRNTQL